MTQEEITIIKLKPAEQEFAIMWRDGLRGITITRSEAVAIHEKLTELIKSNFEVVESTEEFVSGNFNQGHQPKDEEYPPLADNSKIGL